MRRTAMMMAFTALLACGGGAPTGSNNPTPTGTGGADVREFLTLAQKGSGKSSFRVTYEITSSGEGAAGQTTTITFAQRGKEASYQIGEGTESTLIIDPGDDSGQIVCSGDSCFRSPDESGNLGQGLLGPLTALADVVKDADELPGFSSTGSRAIAGRAAECASWDFAGYGDNEVCADAELGVILYWSYSAPNGSTATWEVVEFGEPTDGDFEPTGKVQALPNSEPSY